MDTNKIREKILNEKGLFSIPNILSQKERGEKNGHAVIAQILEELLKDELIYKISSKSSYYINAKSNYIHKGSVVSVKGAYAFIRPDGESTANNDVYVDLDNLNGAMYRDNVRYFSGFENSVIKILERGTRSMVGVISKGEEFKETTFIPDNSNINFTFKVSKDVKQKVSNKDKVEVEIEDYEKKIVKVTRILGKEGERYPEVLGILAENGFFDTFPNQVKKEADKVSQMPVDPEGREDFRNLLTITIDGDDTKDFDDAISIVKVGKNIELYVHIADVSYYVKTGSEIDKEAFRRGTSVYFPENVFPMLPEELSNGICSINPNVDRYALTAKMVVNKDGDIVSGNLYESIIKSDYRLTYKEVQGIINGDSELIKKYDKICKEIKLMEQLSDSIQENLKALGSVRFISQESKFKIEDDKIVDVYPYATTKSNEIIESFMVLANSFVARTLSKAKIPSVYRIHTEPDIEKLESGIDFAKRFNLFINKRDFQKSFNDQIETIEDLSKGKIISYILLRSMAKAKYDTKNIGHYGLGLNDYCHFTSPIRRYPDLMVHRAVKIFLRDRKMEKHNRSKLEELCNKVAKQSSEREVAALKAERDVVDFYKCEFMKNKIGEKYEGIIVSATKFGLFLEFYNGVEGLARFDELPTDYYDVSDYELIGDRYKFAVGDKLQVEVLGVQTKLRRIALTTNKNKDKDDSRKKSKNWY